MMEGVTYPVQPHHTIFFHSAAYLSTYLSVYLSVRQSVTSFLVLFSFLSFIFSYCTTIFFISHLLFQVSFSKESL
ncbi:hypothetical protein QBC42DRAFT_268805 [Cladorrhinum samala]|uniref:Uncharacterized protein n=1 Tax=Cladorrhinum samala TaxID=585594 RepID=A0AAV9HPP1_9PEZI|nr:hypothetical protein QBC42DRAFT_268805 [Cladorrhinum samala]